MLFLQLFLLYFPRVEVWVIVLLKFLIWFNSYKNLFIKYNVKVFMSENSIEVLKKFGTFLVSGQPAITLQTYPTFWSLGGLETR